MAQIERPTRHCPARDAPMSPFFVWWSITAVWQNIAAGDLRYTLGTFPAKNNHLAVAPTTFIVFLASWRRRRVHE
jgi:hypothetical protein